MRGLNKKYKRAFIALVLVWFFGLMAVYLHGSNFAVLNPAGMVALKERNLMITTVLLGMFVVIPVFVMTAVISWRYREGNKQAKYSPDLDHNFWAEALWWGLPTGIIAVLSVITWNSSHALDPHKPLNVAAKPLSVQVVALDWKWLFIYPEQNVASVNYLQLPVGRPVHFKITADAPMNSFWIPQLGGQIYAMPGMVTGLHLMAGKPGDYRGSSANLSGAGFAGMDFTARAGSEAEFNDWLVSARRSPARLDAAAYDALARPSQHNPVALYSSAEAGLYDRVVLKYLAPGGGR
jgi:cytochrome o ubiquinol oxidase subunit 2